MAVRYKYRERGIRISFLIQWSRDFLPQSITCCQYACLLLTTGRMHAPVLSLGGDAELLELALDG